ncbi:hypothetical protein BDW62DRAFT_212063 [Aspergillus aurantiobrunneus]
MVVGIALMAAMVPTVYGLGEASNKRNQDQQNERKDDKQEERYHLLTVCRSSSVPQHQRDQVHNARVYLSTDGKMYITQHPVQDMVPFNGHFFSHPDFEQGNRLGLVTVSPETPQQLRWAFVDANTHQMLWGGAQERQGHISGPFGLHDDEGTITLHRSQKWVAARDTQSQEQEGEDSDPAAAPSFWRLCFGSEESPSVGLPVDRIEIELKMTRMAANLQTSNDEHDRWGKQSA